MTLVTYAGLVCATVIVVWSPIFAWARARWFRDPLLRWLDAKRAELFSCALCLGTWVGIAGSLAHALPAGWRDVICMTCDGAIVGVSAWLIYLIGRVLDEYPARS
jgi:hypothetical protein